MNEPVPGNGQPVQARTDGVGAYLGHPDALTAEHRPTGDDPPRRPEQPGPSANTAPGRVDG
jgi:hypothetical protein